MENVRQDSELFFAGYELCMDASKGDQVVLLFAADAIILDGRVIVIFCAGLIYIWSIRIFNFF